MSDDSTPQGPRAVGPDERDDLSEPILDPADDAAIAALLAGLPEIAMPDDVSARVAAALAAELPLSGAVPAWAAGGSTNVSVLPSQRERAARNARHTRVLSAAAAVVLVLGAVVLGTQFFQGDDARAATPPGARGADQGAVAPEAAEATLFTTSGASYSAADIDTKATGLVESASVAGAPLKAWSETPASADPSPVASPLDVTALAGSDGEFDELSICMGKLSPGEKPVAVDIGTWSAQPAAVIVLAGTSAAAGERLRGHRGLRRPSGDRRLLPPLLRDRRPSLTSRTSRTSGRHADARRTPGDDTRGRRASTECRGRTLTF